MSSFTIGGRRVHGRIHVRDGCEEDLARALQGLLPDVIAQRVDIAFDASTGAIPQVRSTPCVGRYRPAGPHLPDTETCGRRYVRRMSNGQFTLQPTILNANGLEFSAIVAGPASGEPVVLLHGFPESGYAWRHQMEPLARGGLRVIAPDLRGYGFSSKPEDVSAYGLSELASDVLAMADSLGHESLSLVGHDWGAALTWYLAQEFPDRIQRAVVINGPHPGTVFSHAMLHPAQFVKGSYVGFFQLPLLPEAMLRANGFALLRQAMRASARAGTFTDEDLDRYQAAWEVEGALTAMLNWYRALGHNPPRMAASKIRVPMCVLWGDQDAALDPGLAEAGAALCEVVEVHHFPQATHWLHEEEPEAVNGILSEVLMEREARHVD